MWSLKFPSNGADIPPASNSGTRLYIDERLSSLYTTTRACQATSLRVTAQLRVYIVKTFFYYLSTMFDSNVLKAFPLNTWKDCGTLAIFVISIVCLMVPLIPGIYMFDTYFINLNNLSIGNNQGVNHISVSFSSFFLTMSLNLRHASSGVTGMDTWVPCNIEPTK